MRIARRRAYLHTWRPSGLTQQSLCSPRLRPRRALRTFAAAAYVRGVTAGARGGHCRRKARRRRADLLDHSRRCAEAWRRFLPVTSTCRRSRGSVALPGALRGLVLCGDARRVVTIAARNFLARPHPHRRCTPATSAIWCAISFDASRCCRFARSRPAALPGGCRWERSRAELHPLATAQPSRDRLDDLLFGCRLRPVAARALRGADALGQVAMRRRPPGRAGRLRQR